MRKAFFPGIPLLKKGNTNIMGVFELAKSDELVKYVTVQLLHYMETPREIRKQARESQRVAREHWKYRWFGMLPLAIQMWTQGLRIKK